MQRIIHNFIHYSLFLFLLLSGCVFLCCSRSRESHRAFSPITMQYAKNITIDSVAEGELLVTIKNPWDSTSNLGKYLLVDKQIKSPSLPITDATVIKVPLERSIVYSGVHTSLIDELGAISHISGVCDTQYITSSKISHLLSKEIITDCGQSSSPNMEKIISLSPGAVILSPYQDSDDSKKYRNTGIPVIFAADYLEDSPLGRAEWMRFYGRLYGKREAADSLFREVRNRYENIKDASAKSASHPKILMDKIYGNAWSVPSAESVTAIMIRDAGGINIFDHLHGAGGAKLSAEEVLYKAADADIWLIRNIGIANMSQEDLMNENPVYSQFRAFKTSNVYGSDSMKSHIFEDAAFHPDKILKEMTVIFHPEMNHNNSSLHYYRKL